MPNTIRAPLQTRKNWSSWLTSSWAYSLYSTVAVVGIYLITHRSPIPQSSPSNQICQVLHIIDGDSVSALCDKKKHNLRLLHIDAPEITQPIWGKLAQQALQQLADSQIFVEFHGQDVYHRYLAVIYTPDDLDHAINLQLAEQGAVRVYSRYNPPMTYLTAMKQAKQTHCGIWQEKGLHQDPMRYRRLAY